MNKNLTQNILKKSLKSLNRKFSTQNQPKSVSPNSPCPDSLPSFEYFFDDPSNVTKFTKETKEIFRIFEQLKQLESTFFKSTNSTEKLHNIDRIISFCLKNQLYPELRKFRTYRMYYVYGTFFKLTAFLALFFSCKFIWEHFLRNNYLIEHTLESQKPSTRFTDVLVF